jgi:hypothetical protein
MFDFSKTTYIHYIMARREYDVKSLLETRKMFTVGATTI